MIFSRMRLVSLGGLWLLILDTASDAIPDLRGGYSFMVADTSRHHPSGFPTDTSVHHRILDFILTKRFIQT
jgi:hypothetical protein